MIKLLCFYNVCKFIFIWINNVNNQEHYRSGYNKLINSQEIILIFLLFFSIFNSKQNKTPFTCLQYIKNFNNCSSSYDADAILYKCHILNSYYTDS